jgi:uncharacterized membrane protein YtjA (UPF0391 family)
MLKYAIVLLLISVIAGATGMTNVSAIAKRISIVLFAICFLGFLALLGFAYMLGEAFHAGQQALLFLLPGVALRNEGPTPAGRRLRCGPAPLRGKR